MSEDTATEALLEFLDACEAGIASAKQMIARARWLCEDCKAAWEKQQEE